jgi:hypothetical protein
MKSALLIKVIFFSGFSLFLSCCNGVSKKTELKNNEKTIVEKMIDSMGGEEKWNQVESLYIKALHFEKSRPTPYYSEIWRNLNDKNIRIHQWNENFDLLRIVRDSAGIVIRDGEEEKMTPGTLAYIQNWDKHVFYKTIHDLIENKIRSRLIADSIILLERNNAFAGMMVLNDKLLPYKYYTPSLNGDTLLTVYPEWKETNGLKHPSVSMSMDSSFVFKAIEWKPSIDTIPKSFFNWIKVNEFE